MRDIYERLEECSKKELLEIFERVIDTVGPTILPAVKVSLDEVRGVETEGLDEPDDRIDTCILEIEANVINLSYADYIDDQYEIQLIYDALNALKLLLPVYPAVESQKKRFANLCKQYHEVFCDCGCEEMAAEVLQLMN